MIILSIETSCDETAVSIVEADGDFPHATYSVHGDSLFSQVDIHREYGGVFPNIAKREHARTLVPMLERALTEATMLEEFSSTLEMDEVKSLKTILEREPGLFEQLQIFFETYKKPDVDAIAVTSGPGLEPALWVGINFARALALHWNIPVVPVNHMEGHVLSSIFDGNTLPEIVFPALALLISGGHTELVLMKDWLTYELVGQTRDDAVGEAFDKVARMLGLPYPGGPEISKLATHARESDLPRFVELPRPMIDSENLDLSFSGLKTAVRYAIGDKVLTENDKASIAREFEDAATEVLLKKTQKAIHHYGIQTLIIGGGVSANTHIRSTFSTFYRDNYPMLMLYLPNPKLSTDNSVMIALAGHARLAHAQDSADTASIVADGGLSLSSSK